MTKQRAGHLAGKFKSFSDGLVKFVGQNGSRRWSATIENDLRKPVECLKIVGSHFGVLGILRGNLEFVGSDGFHSYLDSVRLDENPLILFAEVYDNCNLLRTKGDWTAFLPKAKDLGVSCLPAI